MRSGTASPLGDESSGDGATPQMWVVPDTGASIRTRQLDINASWPGGWPVALVRLARPSASVGDAVCGVWLQPGEAVAADGRWAHVLARHGRTRRRRARRG